MSSGVQRAETGETLQQVEADLLRETGGVAIEWYGRAATALYRAYTIARKLVGASVDEAEVILPSISCATPANTAVLAGVSPRFADVDPNTGMPTLQTIQQVWTPKTCAVVFIHLYGQTADLGSLAQWCRTNNVLLIEDVAQALGARLPDSSAAGSVADLSVYSFNPTKILECGGGALLLRSSQLLSVCTELSHSDPLPSEIDDEPARTLALIYRNLHHSLVALARARAQRRHFWGVSQIAASVPSALPMPHEGSRCAGERLGHDCENFFSIVTQSPNSTKPRWREGHGVCSVAGNKAASAGDIPCSSTSPITLSILARQCGAMAFTCRTSTGP